MSPYPTHWLFAKRTQLFLVTLILASLFSILLPLRAPTAYAQEFEYEFSVTELTMNVYINDDASVRIVYDITFRNQSWQPIDIVDIGTPTKHYDLSTIEAAIDGHPLTDIRKSEYIGTGFEIHLEEYAINRGNNGTLHVEFPMPDMVYQDTTDSDFASLRITPTWFDPELFYFYSHTDIVVAVHTPAGVALDDLRYHDKKVPFTDKRMVNDRATAYWEWDLVKANQPYPVGISFPKAGMDRVVKLNIADLFLMWLQDNPIIITIAKVIGSIILAFGFFALYYKFTGEKGCIWATIILSFIWGILIGDICTAILIIFGGMFLYTILHKSKGSYLPAIAEVEGGGIKRGLTAVEAAILLEQPPSKVLTLLIFGLLKKGVVTPTTLKPLTVEVVSAYQSKKKTERLKIAQEEGIVLHSYEFAFLDEIERNHDKPIHKMDFLDVMEKLVNQVVKRAEGFDLSDTQDYYKRIIERAYEQAKAIELPEEREQHLDRELEWVLMWEEKEDKEGKDQDKKKDFAPIFTTGTYHYTPSWARGSALGGGSSSGGGGGDSGSGSGGNVSFADVAGSFAGWTENTMGDIAETLSPVDLNLKILGSSGGGGGGGGGGGCACACAGCACACACAGGGR